MLFSISALALLASSASALNLTTVWSNPQTLWYENLAVNSSNDVLLVTSPLEKSVFLIDPAAPTPTATAYATISSPADINGIIPIRQYSPGKFALVAGNLNLTVLNGTDWNVFTLDTTRKPPVLKSAASGFTNAVLFNGMSVLSSAGSDVIVICDSGAGTVWRVNLDTGAKQIVITDAALGRDANTSPPIGVNGINVQGNKLFFTNTQKRTFGFFPINNDGTAAGPPTILANDTAGDKYDDFAIGTNGNDMFALIANHPNAINRVDWGNGSPTQRVFTDDRFGPDGPTSVAFGTGSKSGVAYVTTQDGKVYSFNISETN